MNKPICLIIVNYKNYGETQEFLDRLRQTPYIENVRILVADNTDGRGELGSFQLESFPTQIEVLETGGNLGYMGAGQFALDYLKNEKFEWTILANSDLQVDSEFFIQLMGQDSLGIGALGPAIISGLSGQDTNPYFRERPSREKMRRIALIFSNLWLSRMYQYLGFLKKNLKRAIKKSQNQKAEDVYAIHGAMMIFSKSYFSKGGTFRLPHFLFNEEIFVAETCRSSGLKVRYEPQLRVWHKEHGSMGWNFSRQILEYKKAAANSIYQLYFK